MNYLRNTKERIGATSHKLLAWFLDLFGLLFLQTTRRLVCIAAATDVTIPMAFAQDTIRFSAS